jgi:hypothetical protein
MSIAEGGIHIIYGESSGSSFKAAYHSSDRLLIQRDPLWCGPIRRCASLLEWREIRTEYLKKLFEPHGVDLFDQVSNPLFDISWIKEFDTSYIWAGTGLADQLLILFVFHLFESSGNNPAKINVIQYETFPGTLSPMYATSYLTPEQIRSHPAPISFNKESIDYYKAGWDALIADTPDRLMEFISSPSPPNTKTAAALRYLLLRYPDSKTGLDYRDYQLLTHIGKRSKFASKVIVDALGRNLEGDSVTDLYLFYRLRSLASEDLTEPLLKFSHSPRSLDETEISLTKFGAGILNGETSFYPTNSIDKWIGGVHLSSKLGNLWFYNNGQLVNYI